MKKALNVQRSLLDSGADCYLPLETLRSDGAIVSPGIIDVTNVDQVWDEEVFAPLLQVVRCQDFKHAIEEVNDTQYGLAAGLISDQADLFELFYQQVRAGLINWNRPLTGAASTSPFGGVGASGNFHPSAFYAADYCAYPVSSLVQTHVSLPDVLLPGIPLGSEA